MWHQVVIKVLDGSSPHAGAGAHTEAAKLAGEGPAMPVLCERGREKERVSELSLLPALPARPQPVLPQPVLSLSPSQGGGLLGLRALVGRQSQLPPSESPPSDKAASSFGQPAAPEARGSERGLAITLTTDPVTLETLRNPDRTSLT